jgi:ubiquinone/menaquinone biosynthesis C-methylase UbiE
MTEYKGQRFEGLSGGAAYDVMTTLTNIGAFYRQVMGEVSFEPGMHVLDMGCGTGTFALAVADKVGPTGKVCGVDISQAQISRAIQKAGGSAVPLEFRQGSMDAVPFADAAFDVVVSLVAFHHATSAVRRGALREAVRVLKPGGTFVLADLNAPKPGPLWIMGFLLYAFNAFDPALEDHRTNAFPQLARESGLEMISDRYLTPVIRCQVFRR